MKTKLSVWIALSVMTLSIVLWLVTAKDFNKIASYIGIGYTLLNVAFLVIQIVAFASAHTQYDSDIEKAKMDLLRLEEEGI